MKINSFSLKNFRNYSEVSFELFPGINIFYGENGQGKTNILEAIYMFSSSKSHRKNKDKELIKKDCDKAETYINFVSQGRCQEAKYEIFKDKNKKLYVNGIEKVRLKALFGIFNTVLFAPEDLNLIKGSPEERRRFIDIDIMGVRPSYYKLLKDYNKVLKLKNNLLKGDNIDLDLLDIYNEKIADSGSKITLYRLRFIKRISVLCNKALNYITDEKESTSIIYVPGIDIKLSEKKSELKEEYKRELLKIKREEILKKVSLTGAQRDDIIFMLNDNDAKVFASQGQQRSVILSLKLAEFEFMKEVIGEEPILLLDDILSELDFKRQNKLLKFIRHNQTILTCTDRDLYESIKYPYKAYLVKEGQILRP